MQPGGNCAYPAAQPRTDVLLVLAIVTQATPCLPPPPVQWMDAAGGSRGCHRDRMDLNRDSLQSAFPVRVPSVTFSKRSR